MEIIYGGRQSGKTTKLIEAAIEWMGENEGKVCFIGFHSECVLFNLQQEFQFVDPDNVIVTWNL